MNKIIDTSYLKHIKYISKHDNDDNDNYVNYLMNFIVKQWANDLNTKKTKDPYLYLIQLITWHTKTIYIDGSFENWNSYNPVKNLKSIIKLCYLKYKKYLKIYAAEINKNFLLIDKNVKKISKFNLFITQDFSDNEKRNFNENYKLLTRLNNKFILKKENDNLKKQKEGKINIEFLFKNIFRIILNKNNNNNKDDFSNVLQNLFKHYFKKSSVISGDNDEIVVKQYKFNYDQRYLIRKYISKISQNNFHEIYLKKVQKELYKLKDSWDNI